MKADVKVLLLIRTRRYRDSLAALLATLPGLEICLGGEVFHSALDMNSSSAPDVLLIEVDSIHPEQMAKLQTAHMISPRMKIVLLVDAPKAGSIGHPSGVDLVLPVDTTVGELFQSINRLIGQKTPAVRATQSESLALSC